MNILIAIYLLSVIITFGVSLHEFMTTQPFYKFSIGEKIIALLILPILPVVNLIIVYLIIVCED